MNASERYAVLFPIAQEIALNLTAITKQEWVAVAQNPVEFWNYIKVTSGHYELSIGTYNERITVNGNTPRDKNNQYVRVYEDVDTGNGMRWKEVKFSGITIAAAKTGEQMAKEIVRRFLPDYTKAVRLTLAKIEANNNYAAARRANLEACAVTLNETLRSDYRPINGCDSVLEPVKNFHHYFGNGADKHSGVRVEVNADNKDVDLKIANLSVEQAKRILAFTQEMHEARNNHKGNLS